MNNIIGILECASKYKYGFSRHNTPLYRFLPLCKTLPSMLVGSKIKNTNKNQLVLVDCENLQDKIPKGNIVVFLGECGDLEAEKAAVLWLYCPYVYKKSETYTIPNYNPENVTDLSSWETLNIDPDGCEDIDDCISYILINKNTLRVAITITNVASYIPEDSELNKKVCNISQTFYFKQNRTMLPKSYEENCSLLPNKERYGIALIFDVYIDDEKYNVSNIHFTEVKLINKKSYTYESIYDSNHNDLIKFLEIFSNSKDSHKWIESIMIFYNTQAAELMKNFLHLNPIFRTNDKSKISDIIEKYCPFLSFSSATYTFYNENMYHYGLNIKNYLHITSPIRRYADLYNQRALLSILNNTNISSIIDIDFLNERQKHNKKYERDLFLINLLQNNKEGNITGVVILQDKKYHIYVPEWKRIIKITSSLHLELEQEVKIIYHFNPSKSSWKERIIYQIL
jgi:exoribonuclease R